MFFKKIIAVISSAALLAIMSTVPVSAEDKKATAMRDITTMELVKDMGVGINLGNTYEACGDWIAQYGNGTVNSYVTAWGSPVITKKIIQGYANEGFGVLRVPVAWSNMMAADYTINADYLKSVKQTVDWALESDMYVILNIHYDNGWFAKFSTEKDECMKKYKRIWTQLCSAFSGYDDYLMFESLNEEGCWDDIWNRYGGTNGKQQAYDLLNEINQTFVDLVRASGGNNANRHLLIAGYGTDLDLTCDSMFKMPNDSKNRCAVSVHYYIPSTFCILEEDASWGKVRTTWGTVSDRTQLTNYMNKLKTTFVDKGVPVIIGEYGCPTKNKEADSVRAFISTVCAAACERDMCPVLWDITGLHYSRSTCELKDPALRTLLQKYMPIKYDSGDINRDGSVNAIDASAVLSAYALIATSKDSGLSEAQEAAADVNNDGVINAIDASLILTYYAYSATGGTLSFADFMAKK